LEEIDQQIKKTEIRLQNYDIKHRTYVLRLIIFGLLLEFSYFIYWKFFFFTHEPLQRLLFLLPFLLIVAVVLLFRSLIIMYYQHRTNVDRALLAELELQKEEKLEEYLKKINFQEVESLVNRYSKRRVSSAFELQFRSPMGTPSRAQYSVPPQPHLSYVTPVRNPSKRMSPSSTNETSQSPISSTATPTSTQSPYASSSRPLPSTTPQTPPPTTPRTPRLVTLPVPSSPSISAVSTTLSSSQSQSPTSSDKKSLLEKFISFLVGDAPSQNITLICAKCKTDNGRVFAQEQEEIPFSCSKCGHLNVFNKKRQDTPTVSHEKSCEKEDDSVKKETVPATPPAPSESDQHIHKADESDKIEISTLQKKSQ
jgi:DNA-directed RNA polymerase subunit RPC12/RpoP